MKLVEILGESSQSDQLAKAIAVAIDQIDDSMSYQDFADAVAKVIKDDYGRHLYDRFVQRLQSRLQHD